MYSVCFISYRFFRFFITLPMSRLGFSLLGCSSVARSTFCTLSLGLNLWRVSMASTKAHTEPVEGRPGQTRYMVSHHAWYNTLHIWEGSQNQICIFRVLASTHFEPTSARIAFPCFDEPSFKANFSIRIRRSPEHISLSNMPVVSVACMMVKMQGSDICEKWLQLIICAFQVKTEKVDDGLLEDQFYASVKMSTYLVAFVICDFKSVTATTSSGVQVRSRWKKMTFFMSGRGYYPLCDALN